MGTAAGTVGWNFFQLFFLPRNHRQRRNFTTSKGCLAIVYVLSRLAGLLRNYHKRKKICARGCQVWHQLWRCFLLHLHLDQSRKSYLSFAVLPFRLERSHLCHNLLVSDRAGFLLWDNRQQCFVSGYSRTHKEQNFNGHPNSWKGKIAADRHNLCFGCCCCGLAHAICATDRESLHLILDVIGTLRESWRYLESVGYICSEHCNSHNDVHPHFCVVEKRKQMLEKSCSKVVPNDGLDMLHLDTYWHYRTLKLLFHRGFWKT